MLALWIGVAAAISAVTAFAVWRLRKAARVLDRIVREETEAAAPAEKLDSLD